MAMPSGGSRSRRRRNDYDRLPEKLENATEFSEDPSFRDPVALIRLIKRFPDILDDLIAETDLEKRRGAKRMEGCWALVMLAFTISDHVDVEPFVGAHQSSPIWKEAGFTSVPTPQTAWNRLTELEQVSDAFINAANKLIRRAVRHDPRITEAVAIDSTGFETNAILIHDCENKAACKAAGGKPAQFVKRAPAELVKETRHQESAGPEDLDDVEIESVPVEPLGPSEAPKKKPKRRRRPYRYFMLGPQGKEHRYRTLDPDAGVRRYGTQRCWLGGYFQPMVSAYVDAPVAIHIFSAGIQEHIPYEEIHAKALAATGCRPGAVTTDRGFSIERVFQFNTIHGIASVSAWRKRKGVLGREAEDTDRYDRHGIPRCQHCGGPGLIEGPSLGLYFDRSNPRLRFRCQLQMTLGCKKTQSIACEENWRLLVPLSRLTERYHAIANGGKSLEHVFKHWRNRYQVAGNNPDTRH